MSELNQDEIEALRKVLDYFWEDEQRHYEEHVSMNFDNAPEDYEWNPGKPVLDENHIFASLATLDKALQRFGERHEALPVLWKHKDR